MKKRLFFIIVRTCCVHYGILLILCTWGHHPFPETTNLITLMAFFLFFQAASRHKCTYLVNLYEKEFLMQGGDRNWLNGLDCIPAKLRAICDINKILAHRPWLLNKEHIEVRMVFLG